MTTLIAQITDMHIRPSGKKAYSVVDTEAMLRAAVRDRKSTRLNSSHVSESRMPSSA